MFDNDCQILKGFSEMYRKAAYLAVLEGDYFAFQEEAEFCKILQNFVWNDELKFMRSISALPTRVARNRKLQEYRRDVRRRNIGF